MVRRGSEPVTLAVDLGATKVAARLSVGADYVKERRFSLPRLNDGIAELESLITFLKSFRASERDIDGIGVAVAPTVGVDGRVVRWPNRAYWRGLSLREALENALGGPTVIRDDGCAAAMADAIALDVRDLAHLTLGTGVGGGLVSAGELLNTPRGGATEFGHMIMAPEGRACSCGRKGCLQAYASATALQNMVFGASVADGLFRFKARYDTREEKAVLALSLAVNMLAAAAVNLVEIFNVPAISFSGGLVDVFPGLPEMVGEAAGKLWREGQTPADFLRSPHGPDASLAGAVALARLSAEGGYEHCTTIE